MTLILPKKIKKLELLSKHIFVELSDSIFLQQDWGDISLVFYQFMHWLLVDEEHGVIKYATENGKRVITSVAELYQRRIDGENIEPEQWWNEAVAIRDAYKAEESSIDDTDHTDNAAAPAYGVAYYAALGESYYTAHAAKDKIEGSVFYDDIFASGPVDAINSAYAAVNYAAYASNSDAYKAKNRFRSALAQKLIELLKNAPRWVKS